MLYCMTKENTIKNYKQKLGKVKIDMSLSHQ